MFLKRFLLLGVSFFLEQRYLLFFLVLWGSVFLWIFSQVFFEDIHGGIQGISWIVNADWMMHLSQVQAFSARPFFDVILHFPLYSGEVLTYPFFVNWFSGILLRFSDNLVFSMMLPALCGSFIFLFGIYTCLSHLFNSEKNIVFRSKYSIFIFSSLVLLLIFFGGGLALFFFLDTPFSDLIDLQDYGRDALLVKNDIFWRSFLFTSFVPQRSLMWGMGVGMICFSLFWRFFSRNFSHVSFFSLFFLGMGFGSVAYFHTHSLLFLFVLMSFFLVLSLLFSFQKTLSQWKEFFSIGFGAIFSALPFLWLLSQKNTVEFMSWNPFSTVLENPHCFDICLYWLKNWGILILLLILLLWKPLFFRVFSRGSFSSAEQKNLYILYWALFCVFILSNFVQFQPNWWDNTKIWVWVLCFFSFFLVYFFDFLWKNSCFWKKGLIIIVFSSLMVSQIVITGLVFFDRETQIFSLQELSNAEKFKKRIPQESIVLSTDYFHFFVGPLTPNQLFMGYEGWISSYGLEVKEKKKVFQKVFGESFLVKNAKMSEYQETKRFQRILGLLRKEKIEYVVLDYSLRKKYKIRDEYFQKHFSLVLDLPGNISVYKVP